LTAALWGKPILRRAFHDGVGRRSDVTAGIRAMQLRQFLFPTTKRSQLPMDTISWDGYWL